jgi:sugar lactone lactonase YvrE
MSSAHNDYIVVTDPSGGLLENLDFMQYTNFSLPPLMPPLIYQPNPGYDYQVRDYYGNIISNIIPRFNAPGDPAFYVPYLAINPNTNTLFGTNPRFVGTPDSITGKSYYEFLTGSCKQYIVNRVIPAHYFYQALTFDSAGYMYITSTSIYDITSSRTAQSNIFKVYPGSDTYISIQYLNDSVPNEPADLKGLVVDSSNNLFCVDRMNNIVYKINLNQVSASTPDNLNQVFVNWEIYADIAFGINGPMDVTCDQFNNIYVLSSLTNNIVKITPNKIVTIIGNGLSSNPSQIAYNPVDGLLYVACMGTGGATTYIDRVASSGANAANYLTISRYVRGIACDIYGNIYYSTSSGYGLQATPGNIIIYKVQSLNTTSTYNNPNQQIDTFGNLVYPINSIAFDTSSNLFATNFNYVIYNSQENYTANNVISTGNVWKIDTSNNTTNYYDGSGNPITINPRAIAINNVGKMYVLNNKSYSATNILIYISALNTGTNVTLTNSNLLDSPSVMAFDSSGNLYIVNSVSNTLCLVTFTTTTTASVSAIPIIGEPFSMVNSICVNVNNTYIYASNNGNNLILQIKLATGVSTILSNSPLINKPTAVYQDPITEIIYIAVNNNTILYFTNNTMFELPIIKGITTGDYPAVGDYKYISLKCPSQIIRDNSGNLYIANSANQRDAVVKLSLTTSQTTLYNSLLNSLYGPRDSAYSSKLKKVFIGNSSSATPIISIYDSISRNYSSMDISGTPLPSNVYSLTIGEDASGNDILYCMLMNATFYKITSLGTTNVGATLAITGASSPRSYIRYLKQGVNKYLFIADNAGNRILRVDLSTNISSVFKTPAREPLYLAFDVSGTYVYTTSTLLTSTYADINKTNLSTGVQTPFATITDPSGLLVTPLWGITIDKYNYLYAGFFSSSGGSYITRVPLSSSSTKQRCQYFETNTTYTSLNYNNDSNSLLITGLDTFDERFLSFNIDISNNIGKYNNTMYIFDTSSNTLSNSTIWAFDFSFNVYTPYLVIDPSNIAPNVPTNTTFHFVTPNVVPEPTHSYMLQCNGRDISDVFCNNCTYNKQKFLAGTYPTGLVYSTDTNYLYVALQNNTISRVSSNGIVDNQYFPPELGLVGPTSLVLDASYDMFVLNAGSDFISYLTLRNNIISINNSFYTGIYKPICLTYDPETDLLYLLSGAVPNTRITRINARTGVGVVLPIVFGTLYDPNGLTIDAYYGLFAPVNVTQPPNTKYLYVSNTDQNNINSILRVNLTSTDLSGNITYAVTTLVSGLTYKPFTMANQNDGFLYVANKNNNSLSKISITGLAPNIQPWAVNGISVPVDLGFDGSGNLYVANSGTSPRNSRISKIYVDDFFFTNVKLATGTCDTTEILDITTNRYVEIGYYPSDIYSFPIPVPYPIGS